MIQDNDQQPKLQEGSASSMPDHSPAGIEEPSDEFAYPTGFQLALLLISIYISLFLVALDKLIIATAIPAITNEFHSANDIGWYGTAYLLTNCAFLLVFGKLYTFINVKTTFLTAMVIFEVGSAICGAAPNSIAFIIGRAIAGLGAGGVQSGVIVIIVYAVPLAKRPQYQGLLGAVYGISSIIGPLVGGAFTTNVTWRWCFYLNLPLGGAVLVLVFFLLHVPDSSDGKSTLKHKLLQLNFEGLISLLPGVICLCLALEWGGLTYSWSNGRIIALLVLAGVLLTAFVLVQIWRPQTATVPPRIFKQRSIIGAFWVSCFVGAHNTLIIYYLPIWFQAVKGNSAVESGVHLLALVIALVVASIIAGVGTTVSGYYMPFLIFGICTAAVGAGLLSTLHVNTSVGQWVGYQIVYGIGLGCCFQAPNVAAQTVLPKKEVSIGASLMLFGQTLFGAIFVSAGQNVLDNQLSSRLASFLTISPAQISTAGVTGLINLAGPENRGQTLSAYNEAIRMVFKIAVIVASLTIIGALAMEWLSVKKRGAKESVDSEQQHYEEKKMEQGDGGADTLREAERKGSCGTQAS